MPKNPIDPATGRPRRGRPRKITPVDTISGPQPEEKAVDAPVKVRPLDPKEEVRTPLAQEWYDRMAGTSMMEVPPEAKAKYPEGSFCWAKDSKESVSDYRTRFGYEPAVVDTPLPGQTDTNVRFGDAILMVRSEELKKIHDRVRRDRVRAQMGQSVEAGEGQAEREALIEARQQGYGSGGKNIAFFEESDSEGPLALEKAIMNRPGRTRLAGGTKYVSGGLSK